MVRRGQVLRVGSPRAVVGDPALRGRERARAESSRLSSPAPAAAPNAASSLRTPRTTTFPYFSTHASDVNVSR